MPVPIPMPPGSVPARTTLDIVRQRTTAAAIGGALGVVGAGATAYGFKTGHTAAGVGGLALLFAAFGFIAFARHAEA